MRHILLVLLASFAIAAPAPATAHETPIDGKGAAYEAVIRSGFPFDEAVSDPDAGYIPWLAGFVIAILYVIFLALRPLIPSRPVPSPRAVRRSQKRGRRLRFLLALSPILLAAALVVSMGLQLWELTGVVVALMAVFGVVLVAMLFSALWRAAGR